MSKVYLSVANPYLPIGIPTKVATLLLVYSGCGSAFILPRIDGWQNTLLVFGGIMASSILFYIYALLKTRKDRDYFDFLLKRIKFDPDSLKKSKQVSTYE